MIALLLTGLISTAGAHGIESADFFQVMCQRYLVLEEPEFLERETRADLELIYVNLKARAHIYQHPLDRVFLKLIEHELMTRDAIKPKLRVVRGDE